MSKKSNYILTDISDIKIKDIYNTFGSFGDYVEDLYNNVESKDEFQRLLGKFLKIKSDEFKKDNFKQGDVVLIEYWYKNILTPVLIKEKIKRKFKVSHSLEQSQIQNAPDEIIKKEDIVDFYFPNNNQSVDVNLSIKNSVNSMKNKDQISLIKSIHHYYGSRKNENNYTFGEHKIEPLGKMGFNSFLKVLSALNVPEINLSDNNIDNDFLVFVKTGYINKTRLIKILKRFKSMKEASSLISKTSNNIELFYGLNNKQSNISIVYGFISQEKLIKIGSFNLNSKRFEEIKNSKRKPLTPLKSVLKDLDIYKLRKINKIIDKLKNFNPGYYVTKKPTHIKDGVLCFSYYGWGEWDHGTIKTKSISIFKEKIKDWAYKENLKGKIKFRTECQDFWTNVSIKLK